jgi:hypothetical protein
LDSSDSGAIDRGEGTCDQNFSKIRSGETFDQSPRSHDPSPYGNFANG